MGEAVSCAPENADKNSKIGIIMAIPPSSLAKKFIMKVLERREDMVLSAIAESRDHEKMKKVKHFDEPGTPFR